MALRSKVKLGLQRASGLAQASPATLKSRSAATAVSAATADVHTKYAMSPDAFVQPSKTKYDCIVVGGGHNGLISAAYLAKAGLDVCVLERRHVLGGAAVTEELFPGFKYSRASYVAGLLRPQVIEELDLVRHGLEFLPRDPSSFTPTHLDGPHGGKSLLLWGDMAKTQESIRQFSEKDADAYPEYEAFLDRVRDLIGPILDGPPIDLEGRWREKLDKMRRAGELMKVGFRHRETLMPFYELFTGPAAPVLDRWFESDVLKATLCTDATIGGANPNEAGSAYVLIHHVMGECMGKKGVWAYSRGGMGAVSGAIAKSAEKHGAKLITNAAVNRLLHANGKMKGVEMADGSVLEADMVVSNCTPYHTFLELMPDRDDALPRDFLQHISSVSYGGAPLKINLAVDKLPNFACLPNDSNGLPGPQHSGTIHFENSMSELVEASRQAHAGIPADQPMVEMTCPSAVDDTLAPPGQHVVQLYCQFAPYKLAPGHGSWEDPDFKERYTERIFERVEKFAPGFKASILHKDVLSPLDLERVFGLHQGQLSHGALSLHQLYFMRPAPKYNHRSPIAGLYTCGAGSHPGGGVLGVAGRNCAGVLLSDLGKRRP